ncbi:MAG: YebC/PmpR family DNA-binding transcriptional regulator [bacterium]
MGRAYEVRKASILKTGAAKGKVYTTYAKEIYLVAKKGVPDPESNASLKRLIDKAKKEQVPNDIIERAIAKAKGAGQEDYTEVVYEGFGPGSSTLIIKTLTDNVNRTVGFVRTAFKKVNKSLGVSNSVSYNYDYHAVVSVKLVEEAVFNALIEKEIDPIDFETEDDIVTITVNPREYDKLKDALESVDKEVSYEFDMVGMFPKDEVVLEGEELEDFQKLYGLLDEIDDVTSIYHNVKMD